LAVKSILVLEQFSLTLLKINKVMIREFPEGVFLLKFPGRNFPKFTLLKSYNDLWPRLQQDIIGIPIFSLITVLCVIQPG
jgi:hypothetical protein